MGKKKLNTMGTNNPRLLTIHNWDKIGEGIHNSNVMEGESFYSMRVGSLGTVIVHREIDEESRVVVEISNNRDTEQTESKVWVGSVAFQSPADLLDIFTDVLLSKGWI